MSNEAHQKLPQVSGLRGPLVRGRLPRRQWAAHQTDSCEMRRPSGRFGYRETTAGSGSSTFIFLRVWTFFIQDSQLSGGYAKSGSAEAVHGCRRLPPKP